MSSTSDSVLINSIGLSGLGNSFSHPNDVLLNKQVQTLRSTQTSGTFNGSAQFLLRGISTHMFSFNEAAVEFMIALKAGSGTAFDTSTKLALKNSVLSLITGCRLFVNGSQVLTEQDIQALNNLRLLTEYNKDFENTKGQQLGWYKDDQDNVLTQSIVDSASGTAVTGTDVVPVKVSSPPFSDVIDNTAANRGFMKRLQDLKVRQFAVVDGTVYYKCYVPLYYVSNIFKYFVQPVKDTDIELYIDFDYSNSTGKYFPIQHASGVSDATISVVADYLGGALFVFKPITLNSYGLAKYNQMLQSNTPLTFDFESILSCRKVYSNTTETSFNFQASDSCYRYLTCWMLIVPTGAWSSQSSANPLHCLELPNSFQYQIQQQNQLYVPYTQPREFYEAAVSAKQLSPYDPEVNCNMSYSEYINLYKFVRIPLYRVGSEANRNNNGLNLEIQFTRASSTAADIYIIIESQRTASITQNQGLFSMTISDRI